MKISTDVLAYVWDTFVDAETKSRAHREHSLFNKDPTKWRWLMQNPSAWEPIARKLLGRDVFTVALKTRGYSGIVALSFMAERFLMYRTWITFYQFNNDADVVRDHISITLPCGLKILDGCLFEFQYKDSEVLIRPCYNIDEKERPTKAEPRRAEKEWIHRWRNIPYPRGSSGPTAPTMKKTT